MLGCGVLLEHGTANAKEPTQGNVWTEVQRCGLKWKRIVWSGREGNDWNGMEWNGFDCLDAKRGMASCARQGGTSGSSRQLSVCGTGNRRLEEIRLHCVQHSNTDAMQCKANQSNQHPVTSCIQVYKKEDLQAAAGVQD